MQKPFSPETAGDDDDDSSDEIDMIEEAGQDDVQDELN